MSLPTHSRTQQALDRYVIDAHLPLLLIGETGNGKTSAALKVAKQLLPKGSRLQSPHLTIIKKPDDKRTIPVETVRSELKSLSLRSSGAQNSILKIILIENAQHLSSESQNTLLKNMEEMPEGCIFILTAPKPGDVLATIASRCLAIEILPISEVMALEWYGKNFTPTQIKSAWKLSNGAGALIEALLSDNQSHPLKLAVEHAKRLLKSDRYERLASIDTLLKQTEDLTLLLTALQKIFGAIHQTTLSDTLKIKNVAIKRRAILQAQQELKLQANGKLVLTNLMLTL